MKKWIVVIGYLLVAVYSYAQSNLIPNGSFDLNQGGQLDPKFTDGSLPPVYVHKIEGVMAWDEYSEAGVCNDGNSPYTKYNAGHFIAVSYRDSSFGYLINRFYAPLDTNSTYRFTGNYSMCRNDFNVYKITILFLDSFIDLKRVGKNRLNRMLTKMKFDSLNVVAEKDWKSFDFEYKPTKEWQFIYILSIERMNPTKKREDKTLAFVKFDNLKLINIVYPDSVKQQREYQSVFYKFNNDAVDAKDSTFIDSFISIQLNKSRSHLRLIGYADTTGSAEYNLDLSKRRVENMKAYIQKRYPEIKYIETDYLGETDQNTPIEEYQRRVDLMVEFDKNPW